MRSGERLQRRTCTQLKRQLRTAESAADRLERLPIRRIRERYRQLRTVDRESADDRLTSATEKTTPALSEYHRVSRWQARTSEGNARVRLKYVNVHVHCLRVFSFVKRKICSFTVEV